MKKWAKILSFSLLACILLVAAGCGASGGESAGGAAGGGGLSAPGEGSSAGGGNESGSDSQAGASANIQERSIKVGIISPQGAPQSQGLDKFAELVAERSGGKIKVQVFYSGQLGDDKKMMEQTQAGLQEMAVITSPTIYGTIKEFGIFDLPFIFTDEKEADAIMDGPIAEKLMAKLEPHGLIGLGLWENGFRNITNNKHPVETVEDIKGLKIRTLPNPIHLEIFQTLGANPVSMAWPEVFPALESGALDGQENAIQVIKHEKVYEVNKYVTLDRHLWSPFAVIFSKKLWDQMSEEERQIIKESAREAGVFARETNRSAEKESLQTLIDNGMEVTELSPEVLKQMQDMTRPVIDKYKGEIGEEIVNELLQEIEKVRNSN
jgi:tripartite ATP-independent transporter DctP family solute receptor